MRPARRRSRSCWRIATRAYLKYASIRASLTQRFGRSPANIEKHSLGDRMAIDQDFVGLNRVEIQAKRYANGNTIRSGAIRDFFGRLALEQATCTCRWRSARTADDFITMSDAGSKIRCILRKSMKSFSNRGDSFDSLAFCKTRPRVQWLPATIVNIPGYKGLIASRR